MRRIKWIIIALLPGMICLVCLSGCLRITADELYKLPQASEDYLRLQSQINTVLDLGAEFSPPVSGPNRQAVQLKDLNGDGTNEVIVFFTTPVDGALSIYLFQMIEGDYVVVDVIEGVGTAFESVRYVDMDGDGIMEIIVGRQSGAALKHMSIYSIKDFHSVLIASSEYLEIDIYDMNADGSDDVVVFRIPSSETGAVAELFSLMPDGEVVSSEARLSAGIERILRILSGRLADGEPAVFIDSEGKYDNGSRVTDILALRDGVITNISVHGTGGLSEETVRPFMNISDISKDGIIKVPIPRLLQGQSETPYYAIDWYAYDITGQSSLALTTYHNSWDEWFLILPFDWRGKVSVRREDTVVGERTIIFSYIAGEEGPYEDFLKIYKIFGDTREERAQMPGRAMLVSEGAAVYAFELLSPPNSYNLTFNEDLVRQNFRLLYSEWISAAD